MSSAKRLCPACSVRKGQLISPDCLICKGHGLITLGPAALAVCAPETVAVAITLALESMARVQDTTTTLSDKNRSAPLVKVVDLLERAGVIASHIHPTRSLHADTTDAYAISRSVVGIEPIPLDEILSEAPAFRYTEYDRPNARGLPVLSAGGFPSHLARLVDPAPAGEETRLIVRARNSAELKSKILLAAAVEAVEIKERRKKRK